MLVFAFVPENVFHVLAIALALCILEEGIYQLRQARRPSQPASERRALLVQGSCAVVAGIGIATSDLSRTPNRRVADAATGTGAEPSAWSSSS